MHNGRVSEFPITIRRDDPMPEVGDVVRLVAGDSELALLVSTVTPVVDEDGCAAMRYTFWPAPVGPGD